jgi:hypothetical protein
MTQYCTCSCIKLNQKIQKTSKEDGPYLVSDMYDKIPPYSAWSTEPSMTKYLQYSMGAASKLGPAFRHGKSMTIIPLTKSYNLPTHKVDGCPKSVL